MKINKILFSIKVFIKSYKKQRGGKNHILGEAIKYLDPLGSNFKARQSRGHMVANRSRVKSGDQQICRQIFYGVEFAVIAIF